MKKIGSVLLLCIMMFVIVGCDASGSLSDREKDDLMTYLVDNNYIDNPVKLSSKPRGEGELTMYTADVTRYGEPYKIKVGQEKREEEYRVFWVAFYDSSDNKIETISVNINR